MVQVFRCGASWGAYPLVSVLPAADVSHLAAGVEKQRRQPSELCAAETEAAARRIIATESTDFSLSVGCFYFAMKLFLRHYILPLRRKTDVVRLRDCRAVSAVISASARRHHDDMSSSAGDTLTLTSEDPNYHFNTIQDSRFKKLCCLSHNDRRLPSKSSNNTTKHSHPIDWQKNHTTENERVLVSCPLLAWEQLKERWRAVKSRQCCRLVFFLNVGFMRFWWSGAACSRISKCFTESWFIWGFRRKQYHYKLFYITQPSPCSCVIL